MVGSGILVEEVCVEGGMDGALGKQGWDGRVASRNVVGGGAGSTTGQRWKNFRRRGSASGRS